MAKFVGGGEITTQNALKVVKHLNKLNHGYCEFYRYSYTKDNELFVIYNNKREIVAETFIPGTTITADGKSVISLTPIQIAKAKINLDKKSKTAHLGRIDVYSGFEGKGIGSEILTYFESYCASKKFKSTTLDCLQTFTDGETTVVYRGEREDKRAIEELKRKSKYVVDKNREFYLKNGYEIQHGRQPQNNYLIPMVKTKLVYKKPKIKHIGQVFNTHRLQRKDLISKSKLKPEDNKKLLAIFKHNKFRRSVPSPYVTTGAKLL